MISSQADWENLVAKQVHIFTLFPQMFHGPMSNSIIGLAVERGLLEINLHNFRDYAHDRHHTVDDYPYGGGPGMILKPEPIFQAVESILGPRPSCPVILLTPQGKPFNQREAERLAHQATLAFICGHYGGVDERVREHLAVEELSIGDYVITGGELAAMVVVDAVARLIPSVLGSSEAVLGDSHAAGLLQHPQYTRPSEFRGWGVPATLLSGNHEVIARWRRRQALLRTSERRPDLLERGALSEEDIRILEDG